MGYYLVLENGKLIRKKQPFFANNLIRSKDLLNRESPGPGTYNEVYKTKRAVAFSKTKNIEKLFKSTKLGPGAYNINLEQIKPRTKGISEWKKTTPKETIQNDTYSLEMSFDTPKVDYLSKKELSSFASKVPRFHGKGKAILKEEFSTTQDKNCFVIKKSTDALYYSVSLVLHERDYQDQGIT